MELMKKLILVVMFLILCNLGFSKTSFEVSFNDGTSVNLREKASSNSKILAKLEIFDGGEVIKKEGDWYYIKYRTESEKILYGYIHESQGFLVETYVVSSKDGYANIRWEPSSNGKIAGTEKDGTILEVYDEKGEWLHITYGDSPHFPVAYVHKSQVKKEE
uniref:SH3b domain-containing protein n=1 Tax=Fusobacterium nucleatum subsp. nucleatum TaxID=76856 RepID=Q8KR96_FUSNC|nr:unknown [Fusobacterium nucleatum subsp. nucleatum ATCC 23726]